MTSSGFKVGDIISMEFGFGREEFIVKKKGYNEVR